MNFVLLIADADEERFALEQALARLQYDVLSGTTDEKSLSCLAAHAPSHPILLLHTNLLSVPVHEQLEPIRKLSPEPPVIVATSAGNAQLAMDAITSGANDFIYLPVANERLHVTLRNLSKDSLSLASSETESGFSEFVGSSDALMHLLLKARAKAHSRHHLTIRGEHGVGKTMLARAIHQASDRAAAGIRLQAIQRAEEIQHYIAGTEEGLTLVLDVPEPEAIADISAGMVRQHMEMADKRNVRLIICQKLPRSMAHNSIQSSAFSEAMEGNTLTIPGLTERREDIMGQATHFLHRTATALRRPALRPSSQASRLLTEHSWPGNTRQLLYVIFLAYMVSDGPRLTAHCLEPLLKTEGESRSAVPLAADLTIRPFDTNGELRKLEEIEADYMTLAFRHYRGSRSEIARQLGIGRTTLYRKARQLQLI